MPTQEQKRNEDTRNQQLATNGVETFMKFYRAWTKPQAISFDLDDTLYANHSVIIQAEIALLAFLHQHYVKTQDTNRLFWQTHSRHLVKQHPELLNDMSELRRRSLHKGLSACGYQGTVLAAATEECYEYFYMERSSFQVSDDVINVLTALAKKCPLVAITNGNVDVERIGLNGIFDRVYKSSLRLPRKPHTAMFKSAIEDLAIAPSALLHVGDNLENDIYGAINFGCQAAWFAYDGKRQWQHEQVKVLPTVSLDKLSDLLTLV